MTEYGAWGVCSAVSIVGCLAGTLCFASPSPGVITKYVGLGLSMQRAHRRRGRPSPDTHLSSVVRRFYVTTRPPGLWGRTRAAALTAEQRRRIRRENCEAGVATAVSVAGQLALFLLAMAVATRTWRQAAVLCGCVCAAAAALYPSWYSPLVNGVDGITGLPNRGSAALKGDLGAPASLWLKYGSHAGQPGVQQPSNAAAAGDGSGRSAACARTAGGHTPGSGRSANDRDHEREGGRDRDVHEVAGQRVRGASGASQEHQPLLPVVR